MTVRPALPPLLLALLALFIAWQAQVALSSPRPNDGWVLYLAAVILFGATFRHHRLSQVAGGHLGDAVSATLLRSTPPTVWVLGGLSILFAHAALIAFAQPGQEAFGWALHLLSILVLLATTLPIKTIRQWPLRVQLRWREGGALALILLAALLPRIWQSDAIPQGVWFDEARVGVAARQIALDPTYRPVYIAYIERPAHHAYLAAASFSIFGVNLPALRLVSATFGVLNVFTAYLLFGRWFRRDTHGGLIAAALLAAMRYDLTFSRVAFDVNTTPFFIMFPLFFLDRGLERKQFADFTLAGLTLGLGLAFYLPMRLFVVLLVALGAGVAAVAVGRARSLAPARRYLPHLLCVLLGASIAIAPVAQFALTKPEIFFERNNTASIFYQPEEPDLAKAVWNNVVKYVGMFNYEGDHNGHHNLPGAPMLDPITGILWLLGVGLALWRWRDLPNLAMLFLFGGMLQAGIFSADWEAPQALRVIGVLPALVYCASLALVAVSTQVRHVLGRTATARRLINSALILLLLWIGALNLDTYFNHQATDPAVWASHSIEETWIGKEMNRLATTHDVILTWRYANSPTIQFFAPSAHPIQRWTPQDHLPLSRTGGRPVVMFLDSSLVPTVDEVRRLYPKAEIWTLPSRDGTAALAYEIILNP